MEKTENENQIKIINSYIPMKNDNYNKTIRNRDCLITRIFTHIELYTHNSHI